MRWTAKTLATATLLAGLSAAAFAVDPPPPPTSAADLLDRTRREQELLVSKIESDVRTALVEAAAVLKADPKKARDRLQIALATLDVDTALTQERRTTLLSVLRDRIRAAETSEADAKADASTRVRLTEQTAALQADSERKVAERARVRKELERLLQLRQDGMADEASAHAQKLLKEFPDNAAVKLMAGQSLATARTDEAAKIKGLHESATQAVMADIDRSAIVPKDVVSFPDDWKAKSDRRLKANALSESEQKLLKALNERVPIDFKGTRLQTAVDYLSTLTGQAIIIDKSALDENQLTYDTPVNFSPQTSVPLRIAMRSVLSQLNLTYVVRDGVIQVTTNLRARDMMVTKAYYLGDLVTGIGPVGGSASFGQNLDQQQASQNVAGVIEMVRSTIDPQSWEGRGGTGSIGYNVPTQSLIVRQSAEVHAMLRNGLYGKK